MIKDEKVKEKCTSYKYCTPIAIYQHYKAKFSWKMFKYCVWL